MSNFGFPQRNLLLLRPSQLQLQGLPHQLLRDVLRPACLPDHPHVHRDALKTLETHHQDIQVTSHFYLASMRVCVTQGGPEGQEKSDSPGAGCHILICR